MIEQHDRLRWHDANDPRTRLGAMPRKDRTSNSRMWLQRSVDRHIRRSRLKAPLSPHDTRGRRSRRLPVARDTGQSSTGRREAHSQFEHNANPPQSWAPEIAMLSRSSSNLSASMSCLGRRSHGWAQTAALRALVRATAEFRAPRTATMVISGQGVDRCTPHGAGRRSPPRRLVYGGTEGAAGLMEWLLTSKRVRMRK